ncbi:MAG: S-layer homology domain-containing protein, partial [Oscillospiraceae bacterium]|nr:S-layer homology domain-containing protein [Oscillospiraceae bacterium]
QLAVMLCNYARTVRYPTSARADLSAFADAGQVSSWASDALAWANAVGLINGSRVNGVDYLRPQGNATRAQVSAILHRFCEKAETWPVGDDR